MARQPGLYATLNTSEGTVVCRLFDKEAPKTVANFVELAEGKREWTHPNTREKSKNPLYNGTIFHRVIPNFMIQGGDPTGTGRGGPGYDFNDEPHPELTFNRPYLLAMANAGKRADGSGTNGSQFFITVSQTPHLNFKHTIFGEVVDDESRKVVDAIATTRAVSDRPVEDVVIRSVSVERR